MCGDCCDVTIVMESLWPCQCNDSTSVYAFKLNGTMAVTTYSLFTHRNMTLLQEGNITFSMCGNNCCEICDNRASHDESDVSNETELMIITMATFIVILLILMTIILLSYIW